MKRIFALIIIFAGLAMHPSTGSKAVDFSIEDANGKEFKLSTIKKKMILLDFWASWCGPCRKENPNVVEAYNKYNKKTFKTGKGFEVFSVSLDRDAGKWKEAIKKDGLVWSNHVWDKENVAGTAYQVQFIPSAFLVDGNGVIVASGESLRGLGLHVQLDKQLK